MNISKVNHVILNILVERWPKFKQELLPIVFLSLFQIWLNINYEFYGYPLNTLSTIYACVFGVIAFALLFSFADKTFLKLSPNAPIAGKISLITTLTIIVMFMRHPSLYDTPTTYYVLVWSYRILVGALWYRAANRQPCATAETII